ncbi:MAG: hypothetical protein U1G05_17445 [Kiritimatiellia bacterium]
MLQPERQPLVRIHLQLVGPAFEVEQCADQNHHFHAHGLAGFPRVVKIPARMRQQPPQATSGENNGL